MKKTYQTRNLDLATAITTMTNLPPKTFKDMHGMTFFVFPMTDPVCDAIMGYESGEMLADCKTLLTNKNRLFKKTREVA